MMKVRMTVGEALAAGGEMAINGVPVASFEYVPAVDTDGLPIMWAVIRQPRDQFIVRCDMPMDVTIID